MVQAIIKLGEYEDRVLTIVKGKYGLKNKSDAINFLIDKYSDEELGLKLKPEFIKEMKELEKNDKSIPFKSIKELRDLIEKD